jgi:hypothetical protein
MSGKRNLKKGNKNNRKDMRAEQCPEDAVQHKRPEADLKKNERMKEEEASGLNIIPMAGVVSSVCKCRPRTKFGIAERTW